MFGTTPKKITKLGIFSTVFFIIILFVMGFVSVIHAYSVEKPGWKTYRNSEPEPNGDMQSSDGAIIHHLNPQTSVNQYRILFDEAHNPIHYIIEPDSGFGYFNY